MSGKFITFEGCDGVGKSTQISMLKDYLEQHGADVLLLREPGGNPISEKIRAIILDAKNANMVGECELLLYFAARAQLVQEVIIPALSAGKTVICDRFIDSTIAYQGIARGLGIDKISTLIDLVCKDCMPDATVFLDLDPVAAFSRKGGIDRSDRMELEGLGFHNLVYKGFHTARQLYPDRFVSVSPTGNRFDTSAKIIAALKNKGML